MKSVDRRAEHLVIRFDAQEPELLASLTQQLVELLTSEVGGASAPADAQGSAGQDPFQAWEKEFSLDAASIDDLDMLEGELETDPVIRRLFPDAYRDDPAASHDFRRFSQAAQRDAKTAAARIVLRDLAGTDRHQRCFLQVAEAEAWLKTLTNLRLSLAARLEITDEISADEAAALPEEDPRAWLHEVYSWLGWLQEVLIEALSGQPGSGG